eukprot:307639_1
MDDKMDNEDEEENIEIVVSLTDELYNRGTISPVHITYLFNDINNRCNGSDETELLQRDGNPNLYGAITSGLDQFEEKPRSDQLGRAKKILIFSNCPANNIDDICEEYEYPIRLGTDRTYRGSNYNGFNVA